MDSTTCHVIYVNRSVARDRLIYAQPASRCQPTSSTTSDTGDVASCGSDWQGDNVLQDIQPLLDSFGDGKPLICPCLHFQISSQISLFGRLTFAAMILRGANLSLFSLCPVYACSSSAACLSRLIQLQQDCLSPATPAIVLIDTPHDEQTLDLPALSAASSYPLDPASSSPEIHAPEDDVYGLNLLQKLITESHLRSMAKLVVPVPVISYPDSVVSDDRQTDGAVESPAVPLNSLAAHRPLIRKCLDLGAVDVIISPLSSKCITTLEICAYKAHRDAAREQQELLEITKGRKRSWVGVNQQKPFAYLREAMVSGLMNGICRISFEEGQIASAHIAVSVDRQAAIAHAVGKWHFCAHSFTDDELLVASMVMFKHALAMPGLERWRLPAGKLSHTDFPVVCAT
jgi:hypothetical protein